MSVIVEQNGIRKPERPNTQKAFEELIGHKFSIQQNINDVEWTEIKSTQLYYSVIKIKYTVGINRKTTLNSSRLNKY